MLCFCIFIILYTLANPHTLFLQDSELSPSESQLCEHEDDDGERRQIRSWKSKRSRQWQQGGVRGRCCTQARWPCLTLTPLFPQLVLDGNVLDLAMHYREDFLVLNYVRDNESLCHICCLQTICTCTLAIWKVRRGGGGTVE